MSLSNNAPQRPPTKDAPMTTATASALTMPAFSARPLSDLQMAVAGNLLRMAGAVAV